MVDPIRRVLLKHPKDAYQNQETITNQYKQLNYISEPNFDQAQSDYDQLVIWSTTSFQFRCPTGMAQVNACT